MSRLPLALLTIVFLLLLSANEEVRSQATRTPEQGSPRRALGSGNAGNALGELEAKASASEAKQNWGDAALAYLQAASTVLPSAQLEKALSYGNKALENAQKANNPLLQVRIIVALGTTYRLLGQHAKARELLEKGAVLAKGIDPSETKPGLQLSLYQALVTDALSRGETEKALGYISDSLQVEEKQLNFLKTHQPQALNAIRFVQQAKINTLTRLGNVCEKKGQPEEAIAAYGKALAQIQEAKLKLPIEGNIYLALGQIYRNRKDFSRGAENLAKSLEIAENFHHEFAIQQASSQMASLLVQQQKPAEAIPFYHKAIDAIESTRSLLDSEELRSSFFENKREIYASMILAQIAAQNVEEAFNYNERARSRAFLDILGSKVQLAKEGPLLQEERTLQARISGLQARLREESEGEDDEENKDDSQLKQDVEAARKAYDDFLSRVRKQNAEQASLMNVEPLTLRQVQALLDPDVTVLEYFIARGRGVLWVIDKDRIRFVQLSVLRKNLLANVASLREAIEQKAEKDEFNRLSRQLYRLLIQPGVPHIRGKKLLIIPHDVLHYLPFQALLSPRGRYLIQDYPIYYLSSASLMQFTKQKQKSNTEKALVLGNPNLGDEAYNLRFAEREAKEIATDYPQSAVYLRAEATKANAVRLSPNYDMLHFAVHADLRENDPLNSALLLAKSGNDDGRLKVFEIFSLNLKADTVVLSACETGLGKINNGDELIGLIRAFIYAGTPSVITTLWKVNDQASYEVMRAFYANLKSAKKSEALRQAQLKTMEQFPEPFFWAAYGLTGEP
jgi:CHAT domain-containing protein